MLNKQTLTCSTDFSTTGIFGDFALKLTQVDIWCIRHFRHTRYYIKPVTFGTNFVHSAMKCSGSPQQQHITFVVEVYALPSRCHSPFRTKELVSPWPSLLIMSKFNWNGSQFYCVIVNNIDRHITDLQPAILFLR